MLPRGKFILVLFLIMAFAGNIVLAQSEEPDATIEPMPTENVPKQDDTCVVSVSRSEPRSIITGQNNTITVYGIGFTEDSIVTISNYGALITTLVSSSVLTAEVPSTFLAGNYVVVVRHAGCVVDHKNEANRRTLSVLAPAAPIPTLAPVEFPTPNPGQPSLVTRNFSANPSVVSQGGLVALTFEVFNQGTQAATGISAVIDAGEAFIPASGQASATLPDIFPGGSAWVTLSAVVTQSATVGPTSVPVTITYRDFMGETYSSKASLSVTVQRVTEAPQITLSRYQYQPTPAIPGNPLTVTVLVTNSGTQTASQTLLRIAGDGVLLPGAQGDSFPLGELTPGVNVALELPLVVSREAKPGPQAQGFTLTYLQNGESKQTEGSMTIEIAQVVESTPLLLLDSYEVDLDPLKPGSRFILTATVKNAGTVNALGMMVTFGTVESSGDGGSDGGSGSGNGGTGGGSTTSTTPSTTFAPLGTGGTIFIGDVAAEDTTTFTQEFIVNGNVNTGIYSLPITLRYQSENGKAMQDNLRASVVVVEPPDLTVNEQSPVPPQVNVGEPFFLAYEISNGGTTEIELTTATTSAENAEVIDGAETRLGVVAADDVTAYSAGVMASAEGTVNVTVTIRYMDELNTEREIVKTYETTAVLPPPPPEEEQPPIDIIPTPTPEAPQEEDWLGRLLLGLLGLGS